MANGVPVINITSDKEEDDDHHILTMAEALTDIEDLEETSLGTKKSKQKLMIKLNDDLGGNTDIEDVEGSDDETIPVILKHKNMISIRNFNLDAGIVEETCNISNQMERTNVKLHTQISSTPLVEKQTNFFSAENILTDVENLSGSDTGSSSDNPDIEINAELYECIDDVNHKDAVKYSIAPTPSPCVTPMHYLSEDDSNAKPKKNINGSSSMRLTVSMLQFSNITDIEMLESDAENDNQISKRSKKIKKRRPKNKIEIKEIPVDDNKYLVEESSPKCKPGKFLNPMQKSKKFYQKNDGTTDVEEFEADASVASEYVYDNTAMNKELEKMQCFYGPTKERHMCRRRRGRVNSYRELSDDSDNCNDKNLKQNICKRQNKQIFECKQTLRPPKFYEKCLTDEENIVSSDNEAIQELLNKVKQKKYSGDSTEEEVILETNDYLANLSDIKLPSAKREIMFIKETDASTPKVVIAPLEEEFLLGLAITQDESTDMENMSADDDNFEPETGLKSPDLHEVDYGRTDEREFIKTSKQTLLAPKGKTDNTTDTEEIVLNTENSNKQKRITLTIARQNKSGLTDTEDIYFSDTDNAPRKSSSKIEKEKYLYDNKGGFGNNISHHVGGIALSTKINDPFTDSEQENILNNIKPAIDFLYSPALSDSDDVVPSNDDQSASETDNLRRELSEAVSSKRNSGTIDFDASDEVMYLKGGSYTEIPSEDGDSTAYEGWNAPDDQSKDRPTPAVAKQGAAMQGESVGFQQRSEQQSTPQTFARAEAEESASQRQTTEQDRQVADQHMLSDEMKRLLKELEEESKK